MIFDDFRATGPHSGGGWANLEANIQRASAEARSCSTLDPSMTRSFTRSSRSSRSTSCRRRTTAASPIFRGIFEDNDPKKRLMVVVNYSTDISDFWEFSATGFRPIDESNEAYKLGVNYIIYGLTH